MISSKMDRFYKQNTLANISRQLQHSLHLYCTAHDPYCSIHQRFHYPSTPSHFNTCKQHHSANKFRQHTASHSKIKKEYKSGRSVPSQSGLIIHTTPIKVRRNRKNRGFTSNFDKHQILHFFDGSRPRVHPKHYQQPTAHINGKQVIQDLFCNITAQTAPHITASQHCWQINGWSNRTIERLMLQEHSSNKFSVKNVSSSWQLQAQFNQKSKQQNSRYQNENVQGQSQKDKQSSIKSLLPMFSIAIIPPSCSSCGDKPTSLILNQAQTAKDQPSIKCVSSSNQLKVQLEIHQKQLTSKSGCSLNKTLPKQPSVRSIRRVSNHRQSIAQSQNHSFRTANKAQIIQQLSQNTELPNSVPFLNTLRSHFDSRNKINIDFTPQKQHQRSVVFLKKSVKKNISSEKENFKYSDGLSGVDVREQAQNQVFINEQIQIDLSNLSDP